MVATAVSLEITQGCTSPRAQLVCSALRAAGRALEGQGTFLPFALALSRGDEIIVVTALLASVDPQVEDLIALLHRGLEAGRTAGHYLVTVLVFETEIPVCGDSLAVPAIELRLADERSATTLCFPHARENGRLCLEWPIWRGEVGAADPARLALA